MTTSRDDSAVTIRDVAKLAGVSHMSVSRVLNASPNTSAATRERVERAMSQLNYRPSSIARALATKRTGTIGVLCTDDGRYGPPKTLRAIEFAARDAGYFVSTANLARVDRSAMQTALEHLMDQGIEGLVVIAPQEAMLDVLSGFSFDVPYVTVESTGRKGEHSLAIDQRRGGQLATQHLVDQGHRRILHIAGPTDWLDSQGRIAGWRSVLDQAGLPSSAPFVGDWSPQSGYALAPQIAAIKEATAVFVSNDHMALGLVRGLADLGIRVPNDISVVGFDDIPESEFFFPPLTTVRPDFTELGARCMALLLEGMTGALGKGALFITPDLIPRGSTAPPRT